MKWLFVFVPAILLFSSLFITSPGQFRACLPEGTKLTDVVSVQTVKSGKGDPVVKKITVNSKLIEIKARCKEGRLVDASGREIRFYKLTGCWGNPPDDYAEILERQQNELNELKKRYNVVEIPCDTSGPPNLIH